MSQALHQDVGAPWDVAKRDAKKHPARTLR